MPSGRRDAKFLMMRTAYNEHTELLHNQSCVSKFAVQDIRHTEGERSGSTVVTVPAGRVCQCKIWNKALEDLCKVWQSQGRGNL